MSHMDTMGEPLSGIEERLRDFGKAMELKLAAAVLDQRERTESRILMEERARAVEGAMYYKLKVWIGVGTSVAVFLLGLFYWGVLKYVGERVESSFRSDEVRKQLDRYTAEVITKRIDQKVVSVSEEISTNFNMFVKDSVENLKRSATERFAQAERQIDLILHTAAARADSRKDYDWLVSKSSEKSSDGEMARKVVGEIRRAFDNERYGLSMTKGMHYTDDDHKGKVANDLLVWNALYHSGQGMCVASIEELKKTGQKKFASTFVAVIMKTEYLSCANSAIIALESVANEKFPTLGFEVVKAWWKKNASDESYYSHYENFFDCVTNAPSYKTGDKPGEAVLRWTEKLDETIAREPDAYTAMEMRVDALARANVTVENGEKFKRILDLYSKRKEIGRGWYRYYLEYYVRYDRSKLPSYINERFRVDPRFVKDVREWMNDYKLSSDMPMLKEIKWPEAVEGRK